jgi:octaprenyl-diphosphate synthase
MARYAMHLGSAFQLVDDLLDYSQSSETIGKNIGDDLAEGKPTLPLIYAMRKGNEQQASVIRQAIENGERDRIDEIITIINETGAIDYTAHAAAEEVAQAKAALNSLPDSDYKQALIGLAEFSISRDY